MLQSNSNTIKIQSWMRSPLSDGHDIHDDLVNSYNNIAGVNTACNHKIIFSDKKKKPQFH